MSAEFSVYWWDIEGNQHEELRFVDAQVAVERAMSLTMRPFATVLKLLASVIVTDGCDCCVWQWTSRLVAEEMLRQESDHGCGGETKMTTTRAKELEEQMLAEFGEELGPQMRKRIAITAAKLADVEERTLAAANAMLIETADSADLDRLMAGKKP
jgi:hypothetical protein